MGAGILLSATTSRLALGSTQAPIQQVPVGVFLVVKQTGHEADHTSPSNAEVKNAWSYTSIPPLSSWHYA